MNPEQGLDAILPELDRFFMGESSVHRLQDLADVIALIRANRLDSAFSSELNPWVRAKFAEMLALAAAPDGPA